MKKYLLPTLIYLGFNLICTSASAQISLGGIKKQAGNALGNALENKIQQEMDKAAQKVVDKYWDRVLGKYYGGLYENESSSTSSTRSSSQSAFPFIMSNDVSLEDEYFFDNSIKIQIDTYKKNGKLDETIFINTHTNVNANYVGTSIEPQGKKSSEQDFFIINDFGNNAIVMLSESDGQKMRVAFALALDEDALAKMADEQNEEINTDDNSAPKYEEIGTKQILGYTCKGYRMEDDEVISEVWISEQPIAGMEKVSGMLGKDNKNTQIDLPKGYPEGNMLETTVLNKKTKEKFEMSVIEINPKIDLIFKMEDYPVANNTAEETEE